MEEVLEVAASKEIIAPFLDQRGDEVKITDEAKGPSWRKE